MSGAKYELRGGSRDRRTPCPIHRRMSLQAGTSVYSTFHPRVRFGPDRTVPVSCREGAVESNDGNGIGSDVRLQDLCGDLSVTCIAEDLADVVTQRSENQFLIRTMALGTVVVCRACSSSLIAPPSHTSVRLMRAARTLSARWLLRTYPVHVERSWDSGREGDASNPAVAEA